MRLLLDSHALLWWLDGDERLSATARTAIAGNSGSTFVSAATAWELATKIRLHRLPRGEGRSATLEAAVAGQGFQALPITFTHAEHAARLPGRHGDPFDRMLAAQALCEDLQLITLDPKIASFGVDILW